MDDFEKRLDELSELIADALERDGINAVLVEIIKKFEVEATKNKSER